MDATNATVNSQSIIIALDSIVTDTDPNLDWVKWIEDERKYLRKRFPEKEYFPDDYYERLEAWWSSSPEARLIDPLLVAPLENNRFQLVDGHHRYAICIKYGITDVPVICDL